jgi:hypothetical protein
VLLAAIFVSPLRGFRIFSANFPTASAVGYDLPSLRDFFSSLLLSLSAGGDSVVSV